MKRVYLKGNLPNHLQLFARKLGGIMNEAPDTEFWEASSITELEKNASEIGYEILPTMDMSTEKAFLIGFDAEEPRIIAPGDSAVKLKIYFIETSIPEFNKWMLKIKKHHEEQEQEMFRRRENLRKAKEKRKKEKE